MGKKEKKIQSIARDKKKKGNPHYGGKGKKDFGETTSRNRRGEKKKKRIKGKKGRGATPAIRIVTKDRKKKTKLRKR